MWQKGTTCWPAYAGTSETLSGTLPKAVRRQRSSLTISTRCWTFSTQDATERFLSDLKAMMQHQEMMPQTRCYLFVTCNVKNELFEVWMVEDRVPPSTALELELDSPERPRAGGQLTLPAFLPEGKVSNGTVETELEKVE